MPNGKRVISCKPEIKEKQLLWSWKMEAEAGYSGPKSGKLCINYPYKPDDVPEGILAVPAIGCLLSLAVKHGADIRVPVCDEDFFHSLPRYRDAAYPSEGEEKSRIRTPEVQKNRQETDKKIKSVLFFEGTTDTYFSLAENAAFRPDAAQIVSTAFIREEKEEAARLAEKAKTSAGVFGTSNYRISYYGMPECVDEDLAAASILVPLAWMRKREQVIIPVAGPAEESRLIKEGIDSNIRPGKESGFIKEEKDADAKQDEKKPDISSKTLDLLSAGNMRVVTSGSHVSDEEKQEALRQLLRRTRLMHAAIAVDMGFEDKADNAPETVKTGRPRAFVMGSTTHNNLGDHLIAASTVRFLHEVRPDLEIIQVPYSDYYKMKESLQSEITPKDLLVFLGGGFFGNIWAYSDEMRRDAFRTWKDNPRIMFPQSVLFTEDEEGRSSLEDALKTYCCEEDILAFRDSVSYEFAKEHFKGRIFLAPDIVMYHALPEYYGRQRSGALMVMRSDKEKKLTADAEEQVVQQLKEKGFAIRHADNCMSSGVKVEGREIQLDVLIRKYAESSVVVTDRLHGAVISAITGTPCVVFGNNHHKIKGAMEWMKNVPYVRYVTDLSEFAGALEEVLAVEDLKYPEEEVQGYFEEFREAVSAR